MMNKCAEQMELAFELGSLTADDAAKRIVEALYLQKKPVKLYEKQMAFQSALDKIAEDERPSFKIETEDATIHFSTVRAFHLQSMTISTSEPCSVHVWQEVGRPFFACKGFVQACVSNSEYSFWQNAADPLQYQAAGKSVAGLSMISNGLPKPLQKQVIDTTTNPGRRVLRNGYIEMIGRIMWFGQGFWSRVGASRRQDLLASADFLTSEMRHDILRTIASETAFTDESSKETQDLLRNLLFG